MLARIVLSPRVRTRNRSAVANIYIPILAETVVPLSYIVHLLSLTFYTFRSFSFSVHRPNCITLQALCLTRTLDFSKFLFEKFCWFLARDTYVLIFNGLYLYKLFVSLVKFSRSRFRWTCWGTNMIRIYAIRVHSCPLKVGRFLL